MTTDLAAQQRKRQLIIVLALLLPAVAFLFISREK